MAQESSCNAGDLGCIPESGSAPVAHQAPWSWDFPGKNTGMRRHALQGIIPTQGLNPVSLNAGKFVPTEPLEKQSGLHSAVEQLCLYTHPLFFGFPSHLSLHRAQSRA